MRPLGAAEPSAGWLDTAFALWGAASWEQDLSLSQGSPHKFRSTLSPPAVITYGPEVPVPQGALGNPPQAWMPEKHLCAAPYLTKKQGQRKAALVASKRTTSPGLLCGHWAPLLSGGSQHRSANGCHLPAGRSPAHGTSPLGRPVDKDRNGGMELALPPFPGCHKRDLPPPNQLCDVDTMYKLQTRVRTAVGSGQDIFWCPRRWQKAELDRTGGEAQGSRQRGPAGCSAHRNAQLLEPRPQGCCTGSAPAEASLGKARPDTSHMYLAPGSDNLSLCPSPPWDPESSATSPGVVLSHLWMHKSLISSPTKMKNSPELSCS